jgi:hypothetical protein
VTAQAGDELAVQAQRREVKSVGGGREHAAAGPRTNELAGLGHAVCASA